MAREKAGDTALLTKQKRKGKPKKRPGPDDECRYCHIWRHWANKCLKREDDECKGCAAGGSANYAAGGLCNPSTREVEQVYMAVERDHNKGPAVSRDLLLDTGASSHMFCNREFFTTCTSLPATGRKTPFLCAKSEPAQNHGFGRDTGDNRAAVYAK